MDETKVSTEQMGALKALTDTNLKISAARITLDKLEETETVYLIGREEKAMERIQKIHDDSAELLKQIQSNYADVHSLLASVSACAEYLDTAYRQFTGLLSAFDERNSAWEAKCTEWETEKEKIGNQIKTDQAKIENEKVASIVRKKNLDEMKLKIDSDRGEIERAITRLKEGRT